MTVFSLGNACDLEHFSNNNKFGQENFDMPNYHAPVVPMPTEPPNKPFENTNYNWKSDSAVAQGMTSRNMGNNSFKPSVGRDSQDWGSVNFGPDYWGESSDHYSFDNKLLNDNLNANQFESDGPEMVMPRDLGGRPRDSGNMPRDMVMPGMKPQNAFMPTSRGQFVQNEDMNGRDRASAKKAMMLKRMAMQQQQQQQQQAQRQIKLPAYNAEKIERDQKNLWFFLIALLIVIIGSIMYKTNYF